MNPFEQGPYDQDAPIDYVRCLRCGQIVERVFFDAHDVEECDGAPLYEELS